MSFNLSALDKFRIQLKAIQNERKKDYAIGLGNKENPKKFTRLDMFRLRNQQIQESKKRDFSKGLKFTSIFRSRK